jgi:two-component system phosphate regulon sensor histidine kinase PhoR
MKKIFPIIVVLISLSLVGLIALQISWFNNLVFVKEETMKFKVDQAARKVAIDLSKYASYRNPLGAASVPYDVNSAKPFTLAMFYSVKDIQEKLDSAFKSVGLKQLEFEFALIANEETTLQSEKFYEEFFDEENYKSGVIAITAESASPMEGISGHEYLQILVLNFDKQLYQSLTWRIIGVIIFTIIILAAFTLTLRTLFTQKKLSEIKSDFINNMTHEFKTPLATISLAVDALKNEKVQQDLGKMQYFSGIIKEENKRMNKHVETILQAALMDKQELKLNFQHLHAHEIINKVVDSFRLQLIDKSGQIELMLNAKDNSISADEVHFTNLISNLIDNAIKYSRENLYIKVHTHCTNKHFIVRVEDNGIGMSKESVKRIFEKFYRAHTGNIHNVKGFGLGMSYVKTVVDAHKGKIRVDSTLGKGSIFTIEFPIVKKK